MPPPLEQYAARELQRYLYQLSGTLLPVTSRPGRRGDGALCDRSGTDQSLDRALDRGQAVEGFRQATPGRRDTCSRRLLDHGRDALVIAGSDAVGCLYGVYGLLEEHYGVGFYLGGDVLPDTKTPLTLPKSTSARAPAVAIRGFLPWTNFPQSATVYSWEDWKFILDQMAKMRHELPPHPQLQRRGTAHNEMFHDFR